MAPPEQAPCTPCWGADKSSLASFSQKQEAQWDRRVLLVLLPVSRQNAGGHQLMCGAWPLKARIFPNQVCFHRPTAAHDLFLFTVTMKDPSAPNNLGHYTPGTHHGSQAPATPGKVKCTMKIWKQQKNLSSSCLCSRHSHHHSGSIQKVSKLLIFISLHNFRTIFFPTLEKGTSSEMLLGVSFVSLYKLRWKCQRQAVITSPTYSNSTII